MTEGPWQVSNKKRNNQFNQREGNEGSRKEQYIIMRIKVG